MEGIYFFGDYQRWNLGWNNPNQAGVFVAMWIPWMWGLGAWVAGDEYLGARRSWHGLRRDAAVTLVLAVELGLWFLLCKTYSRGALVAAVASGAVFLAWRHGIACKAGRWRWLAARVAGVALLLAMTGFFSRIDPRFVSQDASAGNRLTLWKGGLQMIAASPWDGWGAGNSGPAFMHWFQALDANEAYAGMVNSYLHVGVERGLPLLAGVIAIAATLLLIAFQASRLETHGDRMVVAAGCSLLVFLIANGFSTLWIFGDLWWLPAAAGLWILGVTAADYRMRMLELVRNSFAISALLSILATAILLVAGRSLAPHGLTIKPNRNDGWISCAGVGNPAVDILFFPDSSVIGEIWGKEVRRLASEVESSRIRVRSGGQTAAVPLDRDYQPRWIIACGKNAGEGFAALGNFPEADLILVHPLDRPVGPERLRGKISVILPMLDTRGTGRQWKVICRKRGWNCRTSPGVAQDVRLVWPGILTKEMDSRKIK